MISDYKMDKAGKAALKCITLVLGTSATGATAVLRDALIPGFNFYVERVEVFAKTVTATISVDVLIGTVSVLASAITPVADTPTAGTLATAAASRRGTSTDELRLRYTTNGTGAATDLRVRVWLRPRPLAGEAV